MNLEYWLLLWPVIGLIFHIMMCHRMISKNRGLFGVDMIIMALPAMIIGPIYLGPLLMYWEDFGR